MELPVLYHSAMTTGQPAVLTCFLFHCCLGSILTGVNQTCLTSSLGQQPPSTSEPSAPEILQPQPCGPDVVSTQPDHSGPDIVSPYPQPNTDALRTFASACITLQKLLG